MKITEGTKLGRYEIRSKIGEGGMGEVYRAFDPKIAREVAIKVLPKDFASDAERVQRFEREAQAAGGLNHPNILAIHDVDSHDGVVYVVSELLEGEELRHRLNEGPILLRKTVDYAQQIISGLSAAHERGITHRDLKPENLFITKDDRVKILDFGLAKLREPETGVHGSEDATKRALTDPGVVMGTVGYMSPEQVRGNSADHRSDIFSFGVILYEMLTGRRAFDGESVVETMHSILKDDVPDLYEMNAKVPPALDRLMRRCAEKKPEHRFHSAHDLGFALDALVSPTSSSGSGLATAAAAAISETRQPTWLGHAAWLAAGVFLISTLVLSVLYLQRAEPRSQTMRFSISPPEKNTFSESFALSPDGQQIAFVTLGAVGGTSLWVRPLTSVDPRQLAGTEGASFPFWSPDSRTIGFFAGGKLRKIEASGGPTQTLADVSGDPRGGTWTPDGTIIFAPITTSPLMRVSASGGPASELTKLDAELGQTSHRWPSMLSDGRHFLYFGRGSRPDKQGIYVTSIDSSESKFLIATPLGGAYTESDGIGYILFIRESALMAQRFDPGDLSLSGEPALLAQGVLSFPGEIGPTAYAAFSASAGRLIYRTGDQQTTRLTWFDRSGKSLGAISEPGGHHEPSLSKDGTKVLFGRSEGSDRQDIYLQDLSRGSTTRLTFDGATDATSVFSPDESQIVFHSERTGSGGIYRKTASGAGNEDLLTGSEDRIAYPDSWSRDGKYLLFMKGGGAKTRIDLWVLPMTGDPTPFPYLVTQFLETHAQFSPDGRWVAYTSDESGRAEVYIQSFPIGAGKWQISTAGGDQSQWRNDGKELFYLAADRSVMAVSIGGSGTLEIGRPTALFQAAVPLAGIADSRNNYVPTQDGQRFLVNMLADTTNSQPLTFVANWAADLKK